MQSRFNGLKCLCNLETAAVMSRDGGGFDVLNPLSPLLSGDKSRKGSVDAPIEGLIELINSRGDVYTTSSCSGRISVFAEPNEVRGHISSFRAASF